MLFLINASFTSRSCWLKNPMETWKQKATAMPFNSFLDVMGVGAQWRRGAEAGLGGQTPPQTPLSLQVVDLWGMAGLVTCMQ